MSDRPVVLVAIKGLGIGGAEKLISEAVPFWDRDTYDYRVAYFLPWKDQLVGEITAHGVEVAAFEFIEDRAGRCYTYDINTNTNYNAAAEARAGVSGMGALARYLASELAAAERDAGGLAA